MLFLEKLYELKENFTPTKIGGVLPATEVTYIKNHLCLETLNIDDLKNLKDFSEIYFGSLIDRTKTSLDAFKLNDKLSAITTVIDERINNLGGEV